MEIIKDEILSEARSHFINGNYKMAESLLNQLLLSPQRNPEIYQMLATIYYDQGQFNRAIKTFKRALEIDPSYTDASVGLSIILNDLGKYDEGKKIFQDAQKLLDLKSGRNEPYIDEKIAMKHEELSDLYFQYKKYSESLEQLLKAQKLTSTRRAEVGLRISECYIKLGLPEQGIKDLKSIISEYPKFLAARLKLGVVYYNSQRIAEATEQWEAVLMRDPNHPEALRYLKMAQAAGITEINV